MIEKIKKSFVHRTRAVIARSYLQSRKVRHHITLNSFPDRYNVAAGSAPATYHKLRRKIDTLQTHIDRDYCVLDLPEDNNIGDHFIYEGSLEFLNKLPWRKKYEASIRSFQQSKIGSDDLILLQGGGNFGDLWPAHQKFREQIIDTFKENKIIILPQTIYFREQSNLSKAVSVFSSHPNLTICTRDQKSYELAQNNFDKNTILLLPDMASYIQCGLIRKRNHNFQKVLHMQRGDQELKRKLYLSYIKKLEIKDWPTYHSEYYKFLRAKHKQHRFYLHEGIVFLANYDLIITTRMHGGILASLLGIPTIFLDNSYGKTRTYYESWMENMPGCYFANNSEELEQIIGSHFPSTLKDNIKN